MESISSDQLATLQRWVEFNGNRVPGKKNMKFLCAQTQLSEQEIVRWWENVAPSKYYEQPAEQAEQFGSTAPITPQFKMSATPSHETTKSLPPLPNEYQFESMDVDFELFPPTQEMQKSWSPIGAGAGQGENYSFPSPFDFNTSQNTSQNRFTRSTSSSSMMDTHPLLSPASGPARASYGSSVWTADTASTLNSVYNPSLYDLMDEEAKTMKSQIIQPNAFNQGNLSRSSYNSIPENPNRNHFSRHNMIQNSPSDRPPPVPAKTGKVQTTYTCTLCHKAFTRKDDWRRHEESHDPQKYWICMVSDPAIQVDGGWMCVFCDRFFSKSQRDERVLHLVMEHKINECSNKSFSTRKWHRKDKLKQHLSQVHNLSETACGSWEEWNRDVPRKKSAWGCGYCGTLLKTWKDRVNHIAEHYEKQSFTSYQWTDSLVVKALLQQRHPEFNIDRAWKALNPNGDRGLEWSTSDANSLKKKLECHSDTPEKIATEAKNMATNFLNNFETLAWASADSRVVTLTNPIEYTEIQKACQNGTGESSSQKSLPNPYPVSMDFEPVGASNFF